MTILHALFLGIIEGLTEFLPISSTFHLLMATRLLGLQTTEFSKFFDVFIQAGAVLAVVALYFREWFNQPKVLAKVMASFVPTAIVGLVLHKLIKSVFFESPLLMISVFVVIGVVFILVEKWLKKDDHVPRKTLEEVTWVQAVIIGLAQATAVLPGVSRAGAVMIAMMVLGYRRDEAAKYSFTLAVPTLIAAAALDLIKMRSELGAVSDGVLFLVAGSVTAFLTAFVVIRWFIKFLRQRTLIPFGIYRLIAGPILFFVIR
jgi:undecaprenyl-diphosphatase